MNASTRRQRDDGDGALRRWSRNTTHTSATTELLDQPVNGGAPIADQLRAVVGLDDLDAGRQPPEARELCFAVAIVSSAFLPGMTMTPPATSPSR